MRKIIPIILFMLLGFTNILFAWVDPDPIFSGKHLLRKMMPINQNINGKSYISGLFLFGFGGISGGGEINQEAVVSFAWQMNTGQYQLMTLPIRKIRVQLDDTVVEPYIKFRWYPHLQSESDLTTAVVYAVIVCKSTDWTPDVILPMNNLTPSV